MSDEEATLLIPFEDYEENAVNIGTQQKSSDMKRFIERVREDGLYLLDVNITDARIRSIAAFVNTGRGQHVFSQKQSEQILQSVVLFQVHLPIQFFVHTLNQMCFS